MKSLWWLPLRLGIPLALLAGAVACWPARAELRYLAAFHLFRTAGLRVAAPVDRAAAVIVPALYLLAALYVLAGRLAPAPRRWARAALALPALAPCVVVLWQHRELLSPVARALHDPDLFALLLGGAGAALLLGAGWRYTRGVLRPLGRAGWRAAGGLGLLLLAGWAGLHLACGWWLLRPAVRRAPRPNVVMIMVDTLRADHVGCYGYPRRTTPHLDRFAAGSTRVQTAIAQAPWTLWSVYSFFTSTYADSAVFYGRGEPAPYDDRAPLLAEILRDEGYATCAVVSNPILQQFPVFARGFDAFDTSSVSEQYGVTSPAVTAAALRRLPSLRRGAPFFLYAVYTDPHAPYVAHPGFSFAGAPAPGPARDPATARARDAYDSEIAFTDAAVGALLDALRAQHLYDDALIVVLSDHGEELRDHGAMGHLYTLYDEVLSVPLLIKLPGQARGTVVAGDFPLLDLAPSLLGLLRANTPARRALGADAGLARLRRCARAPIFSSTVRSAFSVRDARHKFIWRPLLPPELYDLAADPRERANLLPRQPGLAARWRALLQARAGQAPDIAKALRDPAMASPAPMSRKSLETLRSLGYLQ